MAKVPNLPLDYYYGDSFDGYVWQIGSGDLVDGEVETPQDITGWSAKLTVRAAVGEASLLELTSPTGGLTIPVGTDGKTHLSATPAQMLAGSLPAAGGGLVYDIQITNPGGTVKRTLSFGDFVVQAQVTE